MEDRLLPIMAKITEVRSNIHKQEKELSSIWNEFNQLRREQGACSELASDGNKCIMGPHGEYGPKDYHVSQEQLAAGKAHGEDRSRPYHLEAGKPQKMPATSWEDTDMVSLTLVFDDEDQIGARCVAWVRPEDVWRILGG